jgi:hypothetical protein
MDATAAHDGDHMAVDGDAGSAAPLDPPSTDNANGAALPEFGEPPVALSGTAFSNLDALFAATHDAPRAVTRIATGPSEYDADGDGMDVDARDGEEYLQVTPNDDETYVIAAAQAATEHAVGGTEGDGGVDTVDGSAYAQVHE